MATRHVTYYYKFTDQDGNVTDEYYATYDRNDPLHQSAIQDIEAKGDYVSKHDVTNEETALLQDNRGVPEVVDGQLTVTEVSNVDPMLAVNWPGYTPSEGEAPEISESDPAIGVVTEQFAQSMQNQQESNP